MFRDPWEIPLRLPSRRACRSHKRKACRPRRKAGGSPSNAWVGDGPLPLMGRVWRISNFLKDYRVLKYRMPRQPQIPLSLQMTYLQLSKCDETCRTAKMGPPESVQTISSQHAHDIGEISNFIWLPITAVREFCVPTRALCAHIFKFPGKVSAWLAWCGHTELSAWLAWSDSKFANIFSVCWLNTKNIFCTPWGGQILPILQFSLWHEHSRYVIWTESGFEAWWDPHAGIIFSALQVQTEVRGGNDVSQSDWGIQTGPFASL